MFVTYLMAISAALISACSAAVLIYTVSHFDPPQGHSS